VTGSWPKGTKRGAAQNPDFVPGNKIGDDQLGDATEEFEGADVRADPVLHLLARGGFGISVVAGPQDGDEDRGWALWPALRVVDRDRVPGVIDEELLARLWVPEILSRCFQKF
jgi:hypothetical protein